MEEIKILGIPVKRINKNQFLKTIEGTIFSGSKLHIVTVNPEMFVEASKNFHFKKILRKTFNIADGVGTMWASYYLSLIDKKDRYQKLGFIKKLLLFKLTIFLIPFWKKIFKVLPEKLSGSDIFWDVLELANKYSWRVFLMGGRRGVAKKVKRIIEEKFKKIIICDAIEGSPRSKKDFLIRERIRRTTPNVLFVAFGSPKQEVWIERNLKHLNNRLVAIGVGGTFDFVAGKIKRAPAVFQSLGLEWLWRLILEPKKRFKRIINAIFVFPWLILKSK